MMNADLENQCAPEVRELARQYCDGEFNKGEYRRRRREVLQRCIDEDYPPLPDLQEAPLPEPPPVLPPARLPWRLLLVVGTVLTIALLGLFSTLD